LEILQLVAAQKIEMVIENVQNRYATLYFMSQIAVWNNGLGHPEKGNNQ